jgi:methylene-tetrahydromethanopterin dehydrogenase
MPPGACGGIPSATPPIERGAGIGVNRYARVTRHAKRAGRIRGESTTFAIQNVFEAAHRGGAHAARRGWREARPGIARQAVRRAWHSACVRQRHALDRLCNRAVSIEDASPGAAKRRVPVHRFTHVCRGKMQSPYILHMFTPAKQMSPFDVNMAVDAGYQVVVPYAEVGPDNVAALTQDAIFSRGPKGVAHTGIFIGGRDVVVAADMLDTARKSMVPPFEVSVFADPSGAYTTAAALVASVEWHLQRAHDTNLSGKRILVLGGTGPVGVIAAVLAAQAGAHVSIASSRGLEAAEAACERIEARFGVKLSGANARSVETLASTLVASDVVFAAAAAGVQVLSASQLKAASRLLVAADVNAVPPAGIEGVGVMDDGKPIAGVKALGVGALAVGNVKYHVQQRLFQRMLAAGKPVYIGFAEALEVARGVLAERGDKVAA